VIDASYLTLIEAAALVKMDPKTVRNWIKTRGLPACQIGPNAAYRIKSSDLLAFLDRPARATR
jgi:excisionase family DNA binding protein